MTLVRRLALLAVAAAAGFAAAPSFAQTKVDFILNWVPGGEAGRGHGEKGETANERHGGSCGMGGRLSV